MTKISTQKICKMKQKKKKKKTKYLYTNKIINFHKVKRKLNSS